MRSKQPGPQTLPLLYPKATRSQWPFQVQVQIVSPFICLQRRRSPLPIPGLPFTGPQTSDFISAAFAPSAPTQTGAFMTLASANVMVPPLAYGLSYVLWLLHLTSNPFLGRFNGIQVTHPSSQVNGVLSARIDTRIKFRASFHPGPLVQFLKIPKTPSVHKQCPTPEGTLKFSVELKGVGSHNIINFRAATTIMPIQEDGTASIEFFIRCYAHHHGMTNFW